MALLEVTLFSQALMRTVPVNVILPADKMTFPGQPERPEKPFPTLYLLHGVFGSCIDWVSGTRIQRFAEENDLAVVMPSGDNAFYVDQPRGHNNYGEFIGQDLVRITRRMFPLSRKREDTFIGGLSMGGYGALRNGLKYSDTFGAIVALSGALILEEVAARTEETSFFLGSKSYGEACFGDLTKLLDSDMNPKYIVRELKKAGKPIPSVYMACGVSDNLLDVNRDMAAFLKDNGTNVTFEEGPGSHEWDFWDRYIKKAIDWLPLEKGTAGISSGNVGI